MASGISFLRRRLMGLDGVLAGAGAPTLGGPAIYASIVAAKCYVTLTGRLRLPNALLMAHRAHGRRHRQLRQVGMPWHLGAPAGTPAPSARAIEVSALEAKGRGVCHLAYGPYKAVPYHHDAASRIRATGRRLLV